jgi:N-acyl homoserine lactone hydrolase
MAHIAERGDSRVALRTGAGDVRVTNARRWMLNIHDLQTGLVAVKSRQRRGVGSGAARLVNTFRDRKWTEPLPIHAWLVEHPEGLLLIDTGETAMTSERGYFPRWHPYFRTGLQEWVVREDEIDRRLDEVGVSTQDVRWVVMTHLHTDHAGGLHHFPNSEILVARRELEAANGWRGRLRGYLNNHFPEWLSPRPVDFVDGPLGPFTQSFRLTAEGDVVLVPTPGHSAGHLSVLIDEGDRFICIAGDASYTEELLLEQAVDGVAPDEQRAQRTLGALLTFVRTTPTVYLPSHDPDSANRLAERRTVVERVPA